MGRWLCCHPMPVNSSGGCARPRVGVGRWRLLAVAVAALVAAGCTGGSGDGAATSPDEGGGTDTVPAPAGIETEAGEAVPRAVEQRPLVNWEFIAAEDLDVQAGPVFAPTLFGFVQGRFIAVGGGYQPDGEVGEWLQHSWYSTDGQRWELGGMALAAESTGVRIEVRALVPTPDRLFAVGRQSLSGPGGLPMLSTEVSAYESTDGVVWRLADVADLAPVLDASRIGSTNGFPCRHTTRTAVDHTDDERWVDACSTVVVCDEWPDCGEVLAGRGFGTEGEVVTIADGQGPTWVRNFGEALMASTTDLTTGDGGVSDEHWRSDDHGATWYPIETTTNIAYSHPAAVGSDLDLPYVLPPDGSPVVLGNVAATLTLDSSGGFEVRLPSAWMTPDGGRTWHVENFPGYAPFPTLTDLAGGGRYLIAAGGVTQEPYEEAVGIFLGTVDVDHPLVDAARLVEPDPPPVDVDALAGLDRFLDEPLDRGEEPSSSDSASSPSSASPSAEAVLGMTVPSGACQQGPTSDPVRLSDGVAQHDGASLWIETGQPGQMLVGDLDGDGTDDAVAIVNCTFGGNAVFQAVILWTAGDEPRDIWPQMNDGAVELVGDGYVALVRSVELDGDTLVVDWLGSLPGDARCCPSLPVSSRFEMVADVDGEGEFVQHDVVDG